MVVNLAFRHLYQLNFDLYIASQISYVLQVPSATGYVMSYRYNYLETRMSNPTSFNLKWKFRLPTRKSENSFATLVDPKQNKTCRSAGYFGVHSAFWGQLKDLVGNDGNRRHRNLSQCHKSGISGENWRTWWLRMRKCDVLRFPRFFSNPPRG